MVSSVSPSSHCSPASVVPFVQKPQALALEASIASPSLKLVLRLLDPTKPSPVGPEAVQSTQPLMSVPSVAGLSARKLIVPIRTFPLAEVMSSRGVVRVEAEMAAAALVPVSRLKAPPPPIQEAAPEWVGKFERVLALSASL